MNEVVNKVELAGDKFMPEMHLTQRGFIYNTCASFTYKKEGIKKMKEIGDSRYISQNELDKASFQHDMGYRVFKDLTRRTASDKQLLDTAFNIAKTPKCLGYQHGLTSMVSKCFDKATADGALKSRNMSNKELAAELQKPVIRKFEQQKVYSTFVENI